MSVHESSRYVSIVILAAMLIGCDEASSMLRNSASMPYAQVYRLDRLHSWMPEGAKKIPKLLYVASNATTQIFVYHYKSGAFVGWLNPVNRGVSSIRGLCVDKVGNVWITEDDNTTGSSVAVEYGHGGSKALRTFATGGSAIGCSVDPTSGDLAVANWSTKSGAADLRVFERSSGIPKDYTIRACSFMASPGYDGDGNLYVDGQDASGQSTVCELPHKGIAMRSVGFNVSIQGPAGAMWDGKYMTLASAYNYGTYLGKTLIYQMRQDASGNLTEVGRTVLTDKGCPSGEADVTQPFIVGLRNTPENRNQGSVVVGGNNGIYCIYRFAFWKYPRGGNPEFALDNAPELISGQAVSIARQEP